MTSEMAFESAPHGIRTTRHRYHSGMDSSPATTNFTNILQQEASSHPWINSNMDNDQKQMLEAYRSSLSDKARYNFDSDMRQWSTWRGDNALLKPSSPESIRDFVLHCASVGFNRGPLSYASIRHILTSLASLHTKVIEASDPTKSIIVKSEMQNLRRQSGDNQDQVLALRAEDDVPLPLHIAASKHRIPIPSITRLKMHCDIAMSRGLRDRVLLGIGQDLGRRNLDLHLFNHADFTRLPDGRGSASIRRSKTDQRGEGRAKTISRPTMDDIEAWKEWKRENGSEDRQALLNSVDQLGGAGKRLSSSGINYALRRMIVDTLITDHDISSSNAWDIASEVSSHSFRVGLAQDGVAGNVSADEIRDRGDWAQDRRVIAYARNLQPTSGPVAHLRSLVPLR